MKKIFLAIMALLFVALVAMKAEEQVVRKFKVYVNGEVAYTVDANDIDSAKFEIEIIPEDEKGMHNGHEYVDLGLPSGLLWATCNVGAENPEDYGNYYAWGETDTKDNYSWSTYKYGSDWDVLTKYNTNSNNGIVDNKTVLDPEDDAAHVNWGGAWRMPTDEEIGELINNCTTEWTTINGKNGYKVTSNINNNHIFLPAAGCRYDSSLDGGGSYGNYWSSSLNSGCPDFAWYLIFDSSDFLGYIAGYYRYCGFFVRAVCPVNDQDIEISVLGNGAFDTPYNVAAAIASQGEEAYVEGYIVGYYNMNASEQFIFGVDTINTNILIADATGAPAVFMPVQLPKGAVRDALNLKDHPDNLGKKVKLYGSLEKYCGKEGLKSVSYAVLDGAEFGLKPQDNSSAIFYESFESSLGGFTVVDEVKDAALAHIWEFSSQYKCAKATGYSGAKLDGCGWMVSPSIDLSGVTTATLTFQNAGNYFVTPADELQVWVSTTATGEVTSFTEGWTLLTVDKYSSGSFSWAISTIALDAYCGQSNVRIAFRYFSTPDMCGTWEIKEFAIK